MYICANVRRATGLCDASAIPAELIESHVLRHLDSFVGSVEGWLQEQVGKRSDERREREAALERQRVKLSDLDRQRDRHLAEYRALVDEGKTTARIALEEVEPIDRERAGQQQAIDEAEAVLGEWSGPPDLDAALVYYHAIVELAQGRIQKAQGAVDLNLALHQVLAGLWAEIEEDRERLLVEFELLQPKEPTLPGGIPLLPQFKRRRPSLPPRLLDDRLPPESPWREAQIAEAMERAAERAWQSKAGSGPSSSFLLVLPDETRPGESSRLSPLVCPGSRNDPLVPIGRCQPG